MWHSTPGFHIVICHTNTVQWCSNKHRAKRHLPDTRFSAACCCCTSLTTRSHWTSTCIPTIGSWRSTQSRRVQRTTCNVYFCTVGWHPNVVFFNGCAPVVGWCHQCERQPIVIDPLHLKRGGWGGKRCRSLSEKSTASKTIAGTCVQDEWAGGGDGNVTRSRCVNVVCCGTSDSNSSIDVRCYFREFHHRSCWRSSLGSYTKSHHTLTINVHRFARIDQGRG